MKHERFLPYQGMSIFWGRRVFSERCGMTPWALPDPRYNTVSRGMAKRNFYKWHARPHKSYVLFWRTHPELLAKMRAKVSKMKPIS